MYDPLFSVESMDAAVDYLRRLNALVFAVDLDDLLTFEEQSINTFLKQQGLWT